MKYWRLLRYLKNLVKCWGWHKKHHTDVQWELLSMACNERKDQPHKWRVWTGCDRCGLGWTHCVYQETSGIPHRGKNEYMPSMTMSPETVGKGQDVVRNSIYGFHTPDGGTDARKESR